MKKRTIKPIAALLSTIFLFTAACFALIGCSVPRQSIYVITMFGGTDAHLKTFEELNKAYEEETGVLVDNNSSGANATWQRNVRNAFLLERTTPDVLFYFNGASADAIRDQLVSMQEIREAYPDYGRDIKITIQDEYCLPIKGFTEGIIYNTDCYGKGDFESYGKLKAKIMSYIGTDRYDAKRVSAGNDIPHYWVNYLLVLKLGIDEFAEFDGSKEFFSDYSRRAKWIKALEDTIADMTDMDICVNPNRTETSQAVTTESDHFFKGSRGLLVDGSWQAGNMTESVVASKLDVAGFPVDGEMPAFSLSGFTSGWFITRKAWDDHATRDAAVKYVTAHSSAAAVDKYCQAAGGIPATGEKVSDASDAVNKFSALIGTGTISVLPIDDRMNDTAKTIFYGANGLPALLSGASSLTPAELFNAFYKVLS